MHALWIRPLNRGLRELVWVNSGDLLWLVDRRKIESFRPHRARVTFSCLPKRKSPKRRAPRRSAHGTSMCRGSARGGGSFRRHILVPTKRWPTSCRPPCGLIRHPAPLRRGPLKSARSSAQEQHHQHHHQQSAAKAPLESAWMRCLQRGPCRAAGGGGQPEGRCAGCTPFFEGAWMHLRKIPSPHADLEHRMCGRRFAGVSFLLLTLS
jgi:hypothetical protein